MRMTLKELHEILSETGFQVYYNHTSQRDIVDLPFIVYFVVDTDNLFSDNNVYSKKNIVSIILHTSADPRTHLKDEVAEEELERVLYEHTIPYNKEEMWLEDELMYQISYTVNI